MNETSAFDGTLKLAGDRPDIDELSEKYRKDGRVQIADILELQSAVKIHQTLAAQKEWNLVWNDRGKHVDLSYSGVIDWTDEQRETLSHKILTQAETGFQYFYAAIPIYDIYTKKLMPGHFFNDIFEFINSPAFLGFIKTITRNEEITYADMQATRYSKGHFLTEHDDDVAGKNRQAAYVLNLTPVWKNHWGGALVFPGAEDQESSLMLVKFNALNIFSVPQKHYVSYVAPFAGEHRYSITGWFRS